MPAAEAQYSAGVQRASDETARIVAELQAMIDDANEKMVRKIAQLANDRSEEHADAEATMKEAMEEIKLQNEFADALSGKRSGGCGCGGHKKAQEDFQAEAPAENQGGCGGQCGIESGGCGGNCG